ncbi:mechanosensitive ion channel family protein [Brumicola nitratireducens]|uniref:Small-conductance mechanosensitive channel n=1 Tax=Glaciecola nitratireducens (strain JCM 12485 / KCTC 12276 / FR1064) TaxID=1085623 RepID=G4QNQ6_GLANF|nr:mechanosensitive ion channel family protein [Glaciecola nitratireducens]AEP31614.1 MscS mechanosensitive ion channel [Glaciecola nitratireducens FR1064]
MEFGAINNFWTLINGKVDSWLETGIKILPNIVVALVVVLAFAIFARLTSRIVSKILHGAFESRQIADLLSAMSKVVVFVAGVFIALEFLGLTGTVTSLLAGAGILGLAIGFAFQDMTENLIAGIAMGIRKPFQIGDVLEAEGVFGTVKSINLRNTVVETFFGQLEIIPNKILFRNIVTNYTTTGERRIEIPVGISYADDVMHAAEVIKSALSEQKFVTKKDDLNVFAEGFGDSSVNLVIWFWIKYPGHTGFMKARHEAVHLIHQTLMENDILIPFPIRTLDFGAKGGEKLNTMLSQKDD